MKNKLNSLSFKEPRYIGKHKGDCRGAVYYHTGINWAIRRCSVCDQDGRSGTISPELEEE